MDAFLLGKLLSAFVAISRFMLWSSVAPFCANPHVTISFDAGQMMNKCYYGYVEWTCFWYLYTKCPINILLVNFLLIIDLAALSCSTIMYCDMQGVEQQNINNVNIMVFRAVTYGHKLFFFTWVWLSVTWPVWTIYEHYYPLILFKILLLKCTKTIKYANSSIIDTFIANCSGI